MLPGMCETGGFARSLHGRIYGDPDNKRRSTPSLRPGQQVAAPRGPVADMPGVCSGLAMREADSCVVLMNNFPSGSPPPQQNVRERMRRSAHDITGDRTQGVDGGRRIVTHVK